MLYLVAGNVRVTDFYVQRAGYMNREEESTKAVSHVVDAESGEQAATIFTEHYRQKSNPGDARYEVLDYEVFEPLSLASLKTG